jgi:hypothetical protein
MPGDGPMALGVSLRPQYTDWDSMREAAIAPYDLGLVERVARACSQDGHLDDDWQHG